MHAAVLLGIAITVVLVVADWVAFSRPAASALRYGMTVGRQSDQVRLRADGFKADGTLALSHGGARVYPEHRAIMLHVEPKRFGFTFRSAWPINGTVYYTGSAEHPAPPL